MGVALAAIALGGLAMGAAGGIMGSIGQSNQAEAQYLANKVEIERNNFLQSLANDKKNFVAARQNAMRRLNNRKIEETATKQYANALYNSREMFRTQAAQLANASIITQSKLITEATGRNLRGGSVERMKTLANNQAKEMRMNNRKQRYANDFNASVQYENMLNQRDLLSYETASIYMPGSTGVKPGGQTMNMIAGMLGGGTQGLSAGVGIAGGLYNMNVIGPS